ncbi:MAG: AraC family transcriptional regulator [Cyanobacteria bacterium P01_H01_bin.21]
MVLRNCVPSVKDLFAALDQPANAGHLGKRPEIFTLPDKFGNGSIQRWHLRPGLELIINNLNFREQLLLERNHPVAKTTIGMSFCVAGRMQVAGANVEPILEFKAKQANLGVVNSTKGHICYGANQPVLLVHVHLQPDALNLTTEEEFEQLPSQLRHAIAGINTTNYHQSSTMTPVMNATIQQLLNCPYQGFTQQLYMESKAIELISLYFEQLLSDASLSNPQPALQSDERDRIVYARDILLAQVANPPTLLELSRRVGLNDRKLKQGFRQVFGTTAFGYLRNYRMQQAQQLLLRPNSTIAGVAQAVGYSNPEAFSVAFRRTFAISPKAYQLERR